jgi:YHS domain-containing protein
MPKIFTTMLVLAAFAGSVIAADAAADAPKPKPYTLTTCIVSGDKLGEMGDAVVVTREGREIKFCCKGCIKDFDKDPAKFLKKIDDAEAKAKADAGAKTDKPANAGHGAHH